MNNNFSNNSFSFPVSNSKHYLLLFIIWPFVAFIVALANYSNKEAKKVVYFFLVYYGLTFVNSNEAVDSFRYAISLKANANLPFSDFFKIVGGMYSTDTSVDIVEPLISFIVSRFTSNFSVYFAVWAAIYSYFYLGSINILHKYYKENPGWNAMIFMIFFIVILPITSINGVRMWTAAWIFMFSTFHVVLNREPKYLILALSASLVHFSFLSANIILLIYYFAGNRNLIYLPVTIASFIVPRLAAPFFESISMKLGGALLNRFEGYSNENYIYSQQESLEQSSWFLQIGNNIVFYYMIFAIIFIRLRFSALMKGNAEKNLFSFLLLFLAFVNFGMPVASFGSRFQILFFLFATLYIFLYFLKLPGNRIYLLTLLGLFPMLLYAAINFRLGAESISAWLFTPGLGSPLFTPVLSLAEILFY